MSRFERSNVVKNKETGHKQCVKNPDNYKDDEWELVCESPHEDGDMSYLCNNEYCRCSE